MGPRARAGINVSAPTMSTTEQRNPMNSGVCVGSVPALVGTIFFFASEPAMPRTGTISQNRLIHITTPPSQLWNGTFALNPANAEPLLLPMLE